MGALGHNLAVKFNPDVPGSRFPDSPAMLSWLTFNSPRTCGCTSTDGVL